VQTDQPNMRRIGICVFDELLENLREHGQRYLPQLLPPLIQFCSDPSPEVRQASVYGLGLCAQFGGAGFAPSASASMQNIYGLITHAQVTTLCPPATIRLFLFYLCLCWDAVDQHEKTIRTRPDVSRH